MPRRQAPLLELVWPNKDKFLLSPKDASGKPVWVERTHPAASEVRLIEFTDSYGAVGPEGQRARDNLLLSGDSLDVLRVLAEHPELKREYRGQVRCVYMDPPFNTGQAFEHYDDWMEHSTWLSFMRDRLLVIKDLLAPNGSVWVHLDDGEVHRMRCLMDEVFGVGNAVPMIVWEAHRRGQGRRLPVRRSRLRHRLRERPPLVEGDHAPAAPDRHSTPVLRKPRQRSPRAVEAERRQHHRRGQEQRLPRRGPEWRTDLAAARKGLALPEGAVRAGQGRRPSLLQEGHRPARHQDVP